jgi:hypothetical protein
MNTFVLLPFQESMAQRGACEHNQWRGYMTVFVVNHGIIKSICILTWDIFPMIKFDIDTPWDCFYQEVNFTLAIHQQLLTLSAWDLGPVHHVPHTLLCCPWVIEYNGI